ncbi:tyrosine-type recombinase/integrase [Streptomyces sp. G2]|uniref:tyrosine-type recombinase/integrase n=1 Tax=Streptomyces sp. G2 TaxID=1684471 RepID=UPI00202FA60C|nr:tyrosine-type recombinase/integrase [Streptomyces sp. G2]MCM1947737.1 tyrosine-type recombinase/integrase [Streptomyces sp. G2]
MRTGMVLDDIRVQPMKRGDGGWSYTIVWPDGSVDEEADSFLRLFEGSGTQKTYAYTLVDHLRWRVREGLSTAKTTVRDLHRYMGAVGATVQMPFGRPWRVPPKRPYTASGLGTAAAVLKGFYLHQCVRQQINDELRAELDVRRLPTQADRSRSFLGHTITSMSANPLEKRRSSRRRHPKMLPDGARSELLEKVNTARDAMIVDWLSDTTLRVGGLAGLYLSDLHLRENAACGECPSPHVHVCDRWGNPNGAAAKKKPDWWLRDGVITGGEIYRVSPAMISSYFTYMTTEYRPLAAAHGMLLIQLAGPRRGEPLTTDAVRGMLKRAGRRAKLPGRIKPHQFRHTTTAAVLKASGGDALVTKVAGNWSSAAMVEDVYGHPDLHSPKFSAALFEVWGESE